MPKPTSVFSCSNCDSQFVKWQGRCPECGKWGTIAQKQAPVYSKKMPLSRPLVKPAEVVRLSGREYEHIDRTSSGIDEVDRVLGGGFVPGSVYLVSGDPGIGKSTLLLQIADAVNQRVLYISGEESQDQVKSRVDRLGLSVSKMDFAAETDSATILSTIVELAPRMVIIDSIQTMKDGALAQEAGNVTQIKAVTAQLIETAKAHNVIMLIVGHVTKSGSVAGPKTLEHLVDGVLYVEGDQHQQYRILRSTKNRFGSVDEIGVFTITEKGFVPAKEPAKMFLSRQKETVPGSVITPVVEGSRIFFVEYQALVTRTGFGYPVRKSVGFDPNRLHMLLAVLTKRLRMPLEHYDVHVNVTGGVSLQEPACDLAVCVAVMSALQNKAIPASTVVFGEVGLAGEIRPVSFHEKRVGEAKRLGFSKVIAPCDRDGKTTPGVKHPSSIKDVLDFMS